MSVFVAREPSCDEMRGRKHETSPRVAAAPREGSCHAENEAAERRLVTAAEDAAWVGSGRAGA